VKCGPKKSLNAQTSEVGLVTRDQVSNLATKVNA
jgi:hypothetical protein